MGTGGPGEGGGGGGAEVGQGFWMKNARCESLGGVRGRGGV